MGFLGQTLGPFLTYSILLLTFGVDLSKPQDVPKDEGAIMDSWFDGGDYDKRVRPNIREGPIQINVSMYILEFIDVDQEKHEFTMQLYLRQNWEDKRLAYTGLEEISSITLNAENSKKLWIPDTFIANERRSKWHDVTVENEFTRISTVGEVLRSIRLTVTAGCIMDFRYFPFDTNVCSLELESYGHKIEDYYYTWRRDLDDNPSIGSGYYNSISMAVLGQRALERNVTLATGNYSRLAVEFIFQRASFRYIRDIYVPTALIACITFLTLSVGSPQFRVLLSLICLLAMLLVSSITSSGIPPNSLTSLHFYMGTSYFFITATILVNFLVYHIHKRRSVSSAVLAEARKSDANATDENLEDTKECFVCAGQPDFPSAFLRNLYVLCDMMKYILPIMYVVYNLWYWIFFMIAATYVPDDDFILNIDSN